MIAAAIGIAVLASVIAIAVYANGVVRRERTTLAPELESQRQALRGELRALLEEVPAEPAILLEHLPEHPRTAAVEAKLLGSNPRGALAEAERVLAESPGDVRAHLLLARALVYSGELDAAEQQLGRARELGDDSPLSWFLEARTEHLRQLRETHQDNAEIQESPLPSMVSPLEVLLLSLERQRRQPDAGSGVWIPGHGQIDDAEIVRMVSAHFGRYYHQLELLLRCARTIPGFAGALYHCARMALKVGFVDEGRRLFDAIEPLMTGSPEKPFFDRDLAQLRGDESSLVSPLPKLEGTARRASKLRVIE